MNSIRPGARATISGALPKTPRNLSRSTAFIPHTDNEKPAGSGGCSQKQKCDVNAACSRQRAQLRARLEPNGLHRPNLHWLPGVRVEAIARGANGERKRAEADERDFLVAFQAALHRGEHRLRRSLGGGLRSAVAQDFLHFV